MRQRFFHQIMFDCCSSFFLHSRWPSNFFFDIRSSLILFFVPFPSLILLKYIARIFVLLQFLFVK
ncbi:unnamed protein product [Meloidogyne enterolobii]|uniref:Uncharacterized protein n=1 Tax=Meloidogyne enterolobii TaxID=390850 RepID=A0ACB0XMK9_MELEN